MPTVNVDKEELYKTLGRTYTTEEFDELCFEFGIELEEDTSAKEMAAREVGETNISGGLSERAILKIDIPANRYDLLCQEGIARALLVFQEKIKAPVYKNIAPPSGQSLHQLIVKPETAQIREFVVGAILRNITFNQLRYDSFIDLQDKLHNNICRKRTLASMGTHDLDTIEGPFTYEALSPKSIKFIPLNQAKELDGEELMTFYEPDKRLGKFLHIIRDSPVYPVIYDAKRRVCSLPPIINSEHSKIKLTTKNVFIEITATDEYKANVVLNTLVCMFSEYCDEKFTVEPVEVIYPDGTKKITPDLSTRRTTATVDYINACTGLSLSPDEIVKLLTRMGHIARVESAEIVVDVPPTRSDILHACDIMEDVAIAYGYDNLPKGVPKVNTVAVPFPINKLADHVRRELALAGFSEVLPLILCSHDENFAFLNQLDHGQVVKLANPKTVEYQVVRTSLLPGVLKTIQWNKKQPLPIKVFEVSDVAFKDESYERRSRNERHVCVAYSAKGSGFEIVHGLLNRILEMLHSKLVTSSSTELGYFIKESDNPTYFPGRSADVYLRYINPATNGKTTTLLGAFGVLHPSVLEKFEIAYPTTTLEFNLEPFL